MDIGNRIKEIVEKKGMKMEHVYSSIGMTNAGFYRMLKNNSFKVSTLMKIAELLEVPIDEFFTERVDELRETLVHTFNLNRDITWVVRFWIISAHATIGRLEKILARNGEVDLKEIREIIDLIKLTEKNSDKWLYRNFTEEQIKAKDTFTNDWAELVRKHIDNPNLSEDELKKVLQNDMLEILEKYVQAAQGTK